MKRFLWTSTRRFSDRRASDKLESVSCGVVVSVSKHSTIVVGWLNLAIAARHVVPPSTSNVGHFFSWQSGPASKSEAYTVLQRGQQLFAQAPVVYQFSPPEVTYNHYASQVLVTIWWSSQIRLEGRRVGLPFIVLKHGGNYCTVRVLGEPDNKRCCDKGIDFCDRCKHRSVPRR